MMFENHPLLAYWQFGAFGGVGTSRVDREITGSKRCPRCGTTRTFESWNNAKLFIGGKGSKWPDILTCDIPILHERVVDALSAKGFTGFTAHQAEIVEINNDKLLSARIPRYFLIEIVGKVEVDLSELDDSGGCVCSLCFVRKGNPGPYRWSVKRVLPKLGARQDDFVKIYNWNTNRVYGSKRFVDLVSRNRWSNFRFEGNGAGMWADAEKAGGISCYDPLWFDKASSKVRAKNPDLFKD